MHQWRVVSSSYLPGGHLLLLTTDYVVRTAPDNLLTTDITILLQFVRTAAYGDVEDEGEDAAAADQVAT